MFRHFYKVSFAILLMAASVSSNALSSEVIRHQRENGKTVSTRPATDPKHTLANITATPNPGECGALVAFLGNSPNVPTHICTLNGEIITSPYYFPVGTWTIEVTQSNNGKPLNPIIVTVTGPPAPVITTDLFVSQNAASVMATVPTGDSLCTWTITNGVINSDPTRDTIYYTAGEEGNVILHVLQIFPAGCSAEGSDTIGIVSPLPIQLAFFNGSIVEGGNVELQWSTVSEVNNYGFFVERRLPQETQFTTVSGLIAGAGTSLEMHEYSWTDENSAGGSYIYRLKQVDLNNDVDYSPEIIINGVMGVGTEGRPTTFALSQNYPNPFNPTTTIQFSVEKSEHAQLSVYNVAGQFVGTLFDGTAEAGRFYQVSFDAAKLSSGVYYYRITSGSHVAMKSMLLVR